MRAQYVLQIGTYVEREGAWADECTLAQVMKQAADDARIIKVFVQIGAGEPKPVAAKITLQRVLLDPPDNDSDGRTE